MKTIGLIGGMSWESSLHYYRIINQEVKARLGGLHSAKCILYSVDFEEIEECQRSGDWERAGVLLTDAAENIEGAGADVLLLCTNTMHKVADQIQQSLHIPFLHIADATASAIKLQNISTIGLLGTRYTMEQEFYRSRIESNGIRVLIPPQEERDVVHRVIYEELCLGLVKKESREQYYQAINSLVARGAKGIILGCTEIGMLVKQEDVATPLFDTTYIHAQKAVNFALA